MGGQGRESFRAYQQNPVIMAKGTQSRHLIEKTSMGLAPEYAVDPVINAIMTLFREKEFFQECLKRGAYISKEYDWKRLMEKILFTCRTMLYDSFFKMKDYFKRLIFSVLKRLSYFFNKKRAIDFKEIKKILIIQGGGIGDLIRIFPAIESLHTNFSLASIELLTSPYAKGVLSLFPKKNVICEVIDFDPHGIHKDFFKKLSLIFSLRKKFYDLIYVPQRGEGMREMVLMSFLIGAPHRLGFKIEKVGLLSTVEIEFRDDMPILRQNLAILEAAGLKNIKEEIEIVISEKDTDTVRDLLSGFNESYPMISIHAGASWNAHYRCWPLENYLALIRLLLKEFGAKVIIIGTESEKMAVERIVKEIPDQAVKNLIGMTTIPQMAAVIRLTHLFIGNDSGPLHIASAIGVPFIGLFGSTSADQVLSDSTKGMIIREKLPCSPCYLHKPFFKPPCKSVDAPRCMEIISVEEVLKHVRELIGLGEAKL